MASRPARCLLVVLSLCLTFNSCCFRLPSGVRLEKNTQISRVSPDGAGTCMGSCPMTLGFQKPRVGLSVLQHLSENTERARGQESTTIPGGRVGGKPAGPAQPRCCSGPR